MALAKTVAYTPFNKTSFGFGSGEIAAAHSSLTNVKVVMTVDSGHWDTTGHISTTSSGSAVASYNTDKLEWSCSGTVADVDAVLDNLDFFPADYPAIRNWTATATKPNQTTGLYGNEEPFSTNAIPDTKFSLKVYDGNSPYALISTNIVFFDPTQPTFGKQRPYWSTEPSNEDLATAAHALTTGGLVNMGIIAQGSDTDPLTVTGEFRGFGLSSAYTGSAYGVLTTSASGATPKMFIGDKKPGAENTTNRINFTGTKAEVQAYLDNIRYYRCVGATTSFTPSTFVPNYGAFDIYLKISNGVVASEYTKHIYFSDAVIGLTGLDTTQSYVEDTASIWDFGNYTTSGVSPDADEFKAIITLDSVGKGGGAIATHSGTSIGTNTTALYNSTTGALTVTSDTESKLKDVLRNLQFTPEDDFNATNWTVSVQLNYTGSVNGSSYTSTPQTVTVTSGGNVVEINYQNTTHNWTEDTVYEFSVGGVTGNPKINHPGDSLNWTFTMTVSDATAGFLNVPTPTSTYGTFTLVSGNNYYSLTGTKTQVNAGLAAMQYIPATDYNTSFTIGFSGIRTSGNLEHNAIEFGTYTMTATGVGEYSISQATNLAWLEDVNMTFNSGLAITDTATDDSQLPAYGSEYRVELAMWVYSGGAWAEFTNGTIVANTTTGLVKAGAGNQNGQGDTNMISYTGTKAEVNTALASLRFIPTVDYSGLGPSVFYKIVRVSDGAVLTNQEASTKSELATGTPHDEISYTHQSDVSWNEDNATLFDFGVQITDKADENGDYSQNNSTYTAALQLLSWTQVSGSYPVITTASINVLTTITGLTIVVNSSGTTIQGTKTQVNLALQSLKMIPDMDWLSSPDATGKFFTYLDITRDSDSVVILDGSASAPQTWIGFEEGTDSSEYVTAVSGMTFNEDTPKTIFNGLTVGITDAAADNFANITYEVTLSLSDNGTTAANTAGEWTGTGSHIKVLTGTKAVVNAAIQALSFTPTMDYSSDPYILYTQKRYISGSLNQTHVTNGSLGQVTGTASTLGDIAFGGARTYLEDTPKTIFNGHSVGIVDIAADNYANITYEVIVKSSISGAGEWTGTGSHIKTLTGTKAVVNAAIQALEFTPTMDYSTDFDILYSQDRYVSGVLDTTHQYLDVNIGTVTGTASPLGEYYTSMTGATWTEDINNQYIFSGHNIGVTDIAGDNYANITYEVTVSVPSAVGTFDTNSTGTYTITDTKANVNTALQNLAWSPAVTDDFTSFDVTYTQKRYVSGVLDNTQANAVNIGQVTGQNTTEFTYGTGNSNIQYMVQDGTTPNTGGQVLSPFQLTTNHPSKAWSQPITITDTHEDGGASEYKIVFTVPTGTTLYDNTDTSFAGTLDWDTKANLHTKLSTGIRISGATASLSLAFELFRKTATNTEKSIATGSLSYTYISIMSIGVASGGSLYGMGGLNAAQTSANAGAYSDIDMYFSIISEMSSISFSNLGSYLTYEDRLSYPTPSYGLKISNSLPNSTIQTSDITVVSNYGIKLIVTGVKFNMTRIHTSPFTYNNSGAVGTRIQAEDRLLGSNSPQLMHQSNYWDGTYMQIGQQAVEQDGTLLHYTDDRSERFADEFSDFPGGSNIFFVGYNRALVSGPQGYFYAFKMNRSASTGDVGIEVISKTNTNNGLWVPGSGNVMPVSTVKSAYSTGYTQTGWEKSCYVQDIKYDSSNQDIYALCILNTEYENTYAVIMKLHYDGVAAGVGSHTSYAWSVVKEIQLRNSSEHYFIEAYLSNDYETIVTMQTESDNEMFEIDETVTSNNVFRVYDKDQGGTNNWGQVVSNTYTSATTGHMGTRKTNFWHDVNYCAYDGVDTFITADGYKTYRANQGGTNNWGEVSTSLYQPYGIYKFTQNYLFFAGSEGVRPGADGPGVQLFDKSTLTTLTLNYNYPEAFNDDWYTPASFGGTLGDLRKITTSGTGTFFGNNGRFSHNMVEASLSHNMVGVYVLVDEVTWDGTNVTYTGDGEIIWKMYHLQT